MSTIHVNYAALSSGSDGLSATWRRIETLLGELETITTATAQMDAATLVAYRALHARWKAGAQQRQQALQGLATAVRQAGEHYRSVDAALAAQFGG